MASPVARPPRQKPQKLRKRTFLSILRDIAGNATTETVIMIPVFVGIWGGIWYTHQRYRKAINMTQYTRAHTWQHAYNACDGSPPSGNTTINTGGYSGDGAISGVVDLLFGSGIIPGFNFDEIEGRRETSLERPSVLGEGTVTMQQNLVMLCNEEVQGERGFARTAWRMFFGG